MDIYIFNFNNKWLRPPLKTIWQYNIIIIHNIVYGGTNQITWYWKQVAEVGEKESNLVQEMVIQTRGGGQAGDGLRHFGLLALAEPDGRRVGVGLGQRGVDHVLPPAHVHEPAGQLVNAGGHHLQPAQRNVQ